MICNEEGRDPSVSGFQEFPDCLVFRSFQACGLGLVFTQSLMHVLPWFQVFHTDDLALLVFRSFQVVSQDDKWVGARARMSWDP